MSASTEAIEIAKVAGQAASDKLGFDIVAIDVSEKLAITDIFLVVSAKNDRHLGSVVDAIDEALHKIGVKSARREGKDSGWFLVDYSEIVVHVQLAEERENYGLTRLWKDCEFIDLDLTDPEPGVVELGE